MKNPQIYSPAMKRITKIHENLSGIGETEMQRIGKHRTRTNYLLHHRKRIMNTKEEIGVTLHITEIPVQDTPTKAGIPDMTMAKDVTNARTITINSNQPFYYRFYVGLNCNASISIYSVNQL